MDNSFNQFINKLTDLKNVTNNLVPNIKNAVPEIIASNQKFKHATQLLDNMDGKIRHCNLTLDSLHTKLNSQLKESSVNKTSSIEKLEDSIKAIEDFRGENKDSMEQISSKIKDLEDRISQLEDIKILKHANEKPKHPTVNTQEKVVKDNGKTDQQDEDVTFSNHAQKISECGYLILSDSILRRIIPKKFSPNGKTIKRFICGGANTCSNFILKNGEHIDPKNVLIHIGTRDLQNYGVMSDEEFNDLFEASEKIWSNAKKNSCQSFEGRTCQTK
jgi:outer membrane murein-binding lipoprotein Lpp